jgi:TolB protein
VRFAYSLAVAAFAAALLPTAGAPAQKTFRGRPGRIVFNSERRGNIDLYTMTAAGKRLRRLTRSRADDEYAAWSPNGKLLAFTRSSAASGDRVYTMSLNGRGLTPVTPSTIDAVDPTWSPDSRHLAFTIGLSEDRADIVVIDLVTHTQTSLTNQSLNLDPSWSPDGTRIAFASNRDDPSGEAYELYVIGADGSGLTRLTNEPGVDHGLPNWSPDSSRIAYSATVAGGTNIYVMNADGTGTKRLTSSGAAIEPAWSPDGSRIAYSAVPPRRANPQIYTMKPDGTAKKRITRDRFSDGAPDWQPLP